MRVLRWIFSLSVLSIWAALIGTVLYVVLYTPTPAGPAKAIVILGGKATPSGKVTGFTAQRLEAGLALYRDGAADLIVVTGGGDYAVAEHMAAALIDKGVPEAAVLVENRAQSTLQNALFTADLPRIDPGAPILLVTQRYHLPRARASFRWAGFRDVTPHAADPDSPFALNREILLEAVKWPLNLLRAAGASLADAVGVPRDDYIRFLE